MNTRCSSLGINDSLESGQCEENGFRMDPSVFHEEDTLHAGLRDQMDAFYNGIDRDLGEGLSGEVR